MNTPRRQGRKKAVPLPDGPPGMPLIGNEFSFRRDPLTFLTQTYKQYGDLVGLHLVGRRVLGVFGAPYLHQVETAPDEDVTVSTASGFALREDLQGRGILNTKGDEHRRHRAIAKHALAGDSLEIYQSITRRLTKQMMDGWKVGEEVDIFPALTRLSQRIFKHFMFGVDIVADHPEIDDAVDAYIKTILSPVRFISASLIARDIPGISNGATVRRKLALIDSWLIASTKQPPDLEHHSLGRALMNAGSELSEDQDAVQARDNMLQLYHAGMDSVPTTIIWTLLLLAQHPQECRDLLDELQRVLSGREPEVHDLTRLPVLDAVSNETLRLYPGGPYEFSKTNGTITLGGYELPPGFLLLRSPWVTHRSDAFSEPDVFQPRRFMAEQPYVKGAFNPWGAGERICVGRVIARLAIRTIVCLIMQRYRLALAPNQEVNAVSSNFGQKLLPLPGIRMRVALQDGKTELSPAPIRGNITGTCGPSQ